MAFTISSALGCSPNITTRHLRTSILCSSSSSLRTSVSSISSSSLRTFCQDRMVVCFAASTFGSSGADGDWDPYEVLGVNPIAGFDRVKAAYHKKHKDAERNGDQATAALLERAYDKIMMSQLTKRKKGETFGSFQVSKDIKYADKEPIIPWGPRFNKSENKDIQINMAISSAFSAWLFFVRDAQWTPLQFMTAIYVYRIFEKLRAFEASPSFTEEGGEDDDRMLWMGRRLLRSCCLVFGCVAFASVGFTLLLNLIEFTGNYIPSVIYSGQEEARQTLQVAKELGCSIINERRALNNLEDIIRRSKNCSLQRCHATKEGPRDSALGQKKSTVKPSSRKEHRIMKSSLGFSNYSGVSKITCKGKHKGRKST